MHFDAWFTPSGFQRWEWRLVGERSPRDKRADDWGVWKGCMKDLFGGAEVRPGSEQIMNNKQQGWFRVQEVGIEAIAGLDFLWCRSLLRIVRGDGAHCLDNQFADVERWVGKNMMQHPGEPVVVERVILGLGRRDRNEGQPVQGIRQKCVPDR